MTKTVPTTPAQIWTMATDYLRQQTLRWSNERYRHALHDPITRQLHREINWHWGTGDVPAMTRVARGYCKVFLTAGREYRPDAEQ